MTLETIKKAQAEIQELEKEQDRIYQALIQGEKLDSYQKDLLFDFCFNGFPEEDDEIIEKVL